MAVIAAIGGILFYADNMKIDKEEDSLNLLPQAKFDGEHVQAVNRPKSHDPERAVTPAYQDTHAEKEAHPSGLDEKSATIPEKL